jgi:hypothetical protein
MSPAKKSSPKKAATKQSPAKKAAAKKSVAKASVAKKSAARKSVAKKSVAKEASAQRAATKKATPAKKRAAVKRVPVKRTAPTRSEAPSTKRRVPTRPAPGRQEAEPDTYLDAAIEPDVDETSRLAPPRGPALAGPAGEAAEPSRPTPRAVIVGFDGPGPQRRLTVAFRIILAIPHFILLWLLLIAAFFVVVIGWFAALVLGRLPTGLHTFLRNVVEYSARVSAYGFYLLTDRYPPFSFTTPYAVSVDVAPGRLNRAAVFFRWIIAIPAYFVVAVVQSGYQAAAVIIWLIVLVVGRMPTSLWEANAAVLRYITRYYAYLALVTSEYPWGLFGDRE